jgi:hypothetical protein
VSTKKIILAVIALLIASCSTTATPPSVTGETTSTTAQAAPQTTTTIIASTTTAETSQTTTTVPPTPSTGLSSVADEAEGSGCTPGPGDLPDGEWFGYVVEARPGAMEFDLACWFTGNAAVQAAKEEGAESPPPNDYYVTNGNPAIRSLNVADQAVVIWYPNSGDPTTETTVSYADWLLGVEERGHILGVWLEVDEGEVSAIREQWVP